MLVDALLSPRWAPCNHCFAVQSALWAGTALAVSGHVSARMGPGVSVPRGRATAQQDTLVLTAALVSVWEWGWGGGMAAW